MGRAFLLLAMVYRLALPGYHYEFPRDHFNHPDFQTEWWYYTGNLRAADGHRYGFELVFFRAGRDAAANQTAAWRVQDLYLAHLALTDIDARAFRYTERLNRSGPGIAGIDAAAGRIWNGNWSVQWETPGDRQTLTAVYEGIRFELSLTPARPPVIHGENGVSQTGDARGQAAHYVSFPLLMVAGTLNGAAVSGAAWMDHEWFTNMLDPAQRGWDWFSVQLENNSQFMLFQLRRADGTIDAHSSGAYIAPDGRATNLRRSDFTLQPLAYWTSPRTHARYPIEWRIAIPRLGVTLDCAAAIPDQELDRVTGGRSSYWEGAVTFTGSSRGAGYLEMTGYGSPVRM